MKTIDHSSVQQWHRTYASSIMILLATSPASVREPLSTLAEKSRSAKRIATSLLTNLACLCLERKSLHGAVTRQFIWSTPINTPSPSDLVMESVSKQQQTGTNCLIVAPKRKEKMMVLTQSLLLDFEIIKATSRLQSANRQATFRHHPAIEQGVRASCGAHTRNFG